ncbi:MAG: autotransporter-associated beta strand repeat-containing protein [Verrucomicrobiota bacterium]
MLKINCRSLCANLAAVALAFATLTSRAASGSWNVDADGSWSTAGNWLGNVIADGPGSTAYFTNAITGVHIVTVDSARTNANLVFDNANAALNSGGWILSGSGLTLSNSLATPVITVSNINELVPGLDATNDVIISSVITSPQGFVKNGPGTVTLNGANVLGSSAQINEGIVAIGNASALGSGNRPVNFNGGGVRFWTGGPTYANTNIVVTTATLISSNGNYDAVNGPWFGSGTILIHSTGRLTPGNGANTTFAGFTGTIDLTDSTSANETRFNLGSGATPYNLVGVTLNAGTNAGRFDFRPTVAPARVMIGALMGGPASRLQSSENAGGTSLFWEIGYLNTSTLFEGVIANRNNTADRVGHLVKVGTGRLTLTGTSTYTGNTIVSNGVLALSNNAALTITTNITVHSPGTLDVSGLVTPFTLNADTKVLAGSGVVTGNVAITTGTISPGFGAGSVATFTFTNDLSIDGTLLTTTNAFEIGTGVNDRIAIGGNLTLAGTVVVKLTPTGPSIPNGTYNIYSWSGNLTGDLSNLVLTYAPQPGTITLGTNLVTKTIFVQVSGAASSDLTWRGDGVANDWDVNATANWRTTGGAATVFNNGDNVTFNDTGSNNVPVNLPGTVNPGVVLITNVAKNYELASTSGGKISGAAVITKRGSGIAILSTDNDNNGLTTILGGVLQIGNGGSSGTLGSGGVTNAGTLVFNRDVAANNGVITGPGSVIQTGSGALTLSGVNTYSGNTVVSNGTLNIGGANALGSGTLVLAGGTASAGAVAIPNALNVIGNSTINNTAGEIQWTSASVSGSSGVTLGLSGVQMRFSSGSFTLDSAIDLQGTFILRSYNPTGTQTFNGVISGSGTYQRRWPDSNVANDGATVFNGANTYTGDTLLREGSIGFGISSVSSVPPTVDSGPIGTGTLRQDNATYTAVFASGAARTVGNPIILNSGGQAFIIKGALDLTLSGTVDLGGASKTIQADNTAKSILSGDISNGSLVKTGAGALYINGNNNATDTTVQAGTLGGTGTFSGPVTVQSGATLAPGASIGTLTINSDLTIGGNLAIEVNKSVSPSNDVVTVTGVLTNSGTGTLTVANLGPALAVGNKFTLFSQPVLNGGAITVTGAGATWSNNLAVDGSITVASIGGQPTLNFAKVGNNLQFTWTGSYKLQAQTNTLNTGLSGNWGDYPGGGSSPVNVPIDTTKGAVFFRLVTAP